MKRWPELRRPECRDSLRTTFRCAIAVVLALWIALPGAAIPAQVDASGRVVTFTKEFPGSVPPFYSVNVKSALKLGQVRGVALFKAADAALPVYEYSPLQIKSSVVGYGRADKNQVQQMVKILLSLKELPPEDAADALAVALCHAHCAQTQEKLASARSGRTGPGPAARAVQSPRI